MKSVLFVGAGRHQRRAIEHARASGSASSRSTATPRRPGLAVGRRRRGRRLHRRRGGDRGRPAASRRRRADRVGRPRGSGRRRRRRGARAARDRNRHRTPDDAQARDARRARRGRRPAAALRGPRSRDDIGAALEAFGLPGGAETRRLGRPASGLPGRERSELERDLQEALAESPTDEAMVEAFVDGIEMNGIVIARGGEPRAAHALGPAAPAGNRLRRRLDPRLPAVDPRRAAAARRADRGRVGARARPPGRDRVPAAHRGAGRRGRGRRGRGAHPGRPDGRPRAPRGRRRPRRDRAPPGARRGRVRTSSRCPRFTQPLAIRFFTAAPGPLPDRPGRFDRQPRPVLAAEGVVQADTYLEVGETIRPVRRDGDRRGYVIAVGDTSDTAVRRADDAAALLTVEVAA